MAPVALTSMIVITSRHAWRYAERPVAADLPPLTLYPSRKKWLYVAAVCAGVAILGLVEVLRGDVVERIFGWLFLAFFGCGLIAAVINLLPNASYLRLDAKGFTAC